MSCGIGLGLGLGKGGAVLGDPVGFARTFRTVEEVQLDTTYIPNYTGICRIIAWGAGANGSPTELGNRNGGGSGACNIFTLPVIAGVTQIRMLICDGKTATDSTLILIDNGVVTLQVESGRNNDQNVPAHCQIGDVTPATIIDGRDGQIGGWPNTGVFDDGGGGASAPYLVDAATLGEGSPGLAPDETGTGGTGGANPGFDNAGGGGNGAGLSAPAGNGVWPGGAGGGPSVTQTTPGEGAGGAVICQRVE